MRRGVPQSGGILLAAFITMVSTHQATAQVVLEGGVTIYRHPSAFGPYTLTGAALGVAEGLGPSAEFVANVELTETKRQAGESIRVSAIDVGVGALLLRRSRVTLRLGLGVTASLAKSSQEDENGGQISPFLDLAIRVWPWPHAGLLLRGIGRHTPDRESSFGRSLILGICVRP